MIKIPKYLKFANRTANLSILSGLCYYIYLTINYKKFIKEKIKVIQTDMTSLFTTQEMLEIENKSVKQWYRNSFTMFTDYKQIYKDIRKIMGYPIDNFKKEIQFNV